jgi:glycosyltransferase involved in cell wall biosynthesis
MDYINRKKTKPVILCFSSFYLPGFKSGGLVRSIVNFVDNLADEFDIQIICSDRDISDSKSYSNIKINSWNLIGKAKIFYASSKALSISSIIKLIRNTPHDILYLNSIFSLRFSIIPLLVRFFYRHLKQPCIISPRGELSDGALAQKKYKKFIYIKFAKYLKLHCNLLWLASSSNESSDIYKSFGKIVKKVEIISDNFKFMSIPKNSIPKKRSKILRIIFLSRISPMKNLDYLLRVLSKVSEPLEVDIYGPIEDIRYWKKCQKLINILPCHIKVNIRGEVNSNNIQNTFLQYDLFAFPTKGENFGHVILESLSASTPVLVSNLTLWKSDKLLGVKAIPLIEDVWVHEIESWAKLTTQELFERRKASLTRADYFIKKIKKSSKNYRKIFFDFLKLN